MRVSASSCTRSVKAQDEGEGERKKCIMYSLCCLKLWNHVDFDAECALIENLGNAALPLYR